ncbi:glycosyl hydrolase family 28-related protein [Frigoribacterium sp. CFBP9030]|uniref:glycosyl hydrolase family 28-related protein n=2 Tax=Frigoribacterium TaxID=96492 RepID=UPI002A6ADCAA|nr:glycosyl hydrolase family 28-related protein [Frigoribacterium sp. CFBP9030]MDY0890591.1 glycosyl hydrolase family 28-related protein [Frigoribacterium sp. CFBP9030]
MSTSDSGGRYGSRRLFLAAGATAAAAALVLDGGGAAPAVAAGPTDVDDPHVAVDVKRIGARGDGRTNDTVAFQQALDLAAKVRGRVVVPAGAYLIDSVSVPMLVKIQGLGSDISRYGSGTSGGVNLRHLPTSTAPMVVVTGPGTTLEGLTLQGNGSDAPLLRVDNGFESRFDRVHLANVAGTALLAQRVNNAFWSDVFVNNCGTETDAAMVVRSPPAEMSLTNSNTLTCVDLTIEGSPGPALDLGWGASGEHFVEFVRLVAPHIEALQTGSAPEAVIRVGNVRHVELVSPFLYGGGGPLIEHRRQRPRGVVLEGGIRVMGGALLGVDPAKATANDHLVRLTDGDDFALIGTRLGRFTGAAVAVGADYGANVMIDPTTRIQLSKGASPVRDERPARALPVWGWPGGVTAAADVEVGRHLLAGRATAPTAQPLPAAALGAAPIVAAGGDSAGSVRYTPGAAAKAGPQVRLRFAAPFATPPTVVLTAQSAAAAASRPYVSVTKDHIEICVVEPLPAAQRGEVAFGYQVVG